MEATPASHIVALVRDSATASAVSVALSEHGVEAPIIVSGEGEMVGERLAAESGFVDRALQTLFGHLSEQGDYLEQYEEAARNGQTVVAVKANRIMMKKCRARQVSSRSTALRTCASSAVLPSPTRPSER